MKKKCKSEAKQVITVTEVEKLRNRQCQSWLRKNGKEIHGGNKKQWSKISGKQTWSFNRQQQQLKVENGEQKAKIILTLMTRDQTGNNIFNNTWARERQEDRLKNIYFPLCSCVFFSLLTLSCSRSKLFILLKKAHLINTWLTNQDSWCTTNTYKL